jgi:hypothetical protein
VTPEEVVASTGVDRRQLEVLARRTAR